MKVQSVSTPPRPAAARLVALSALALGLTLTGAAPAAAAPADPGPRPGTVTVVGTGSASAAPDLAIVSAGVEAKKATAKEALAAQGTAAKALLDAVRRQGVAERDIRTEGLSLSPVHETNNGTSKLTGYQAGQSFSIKVRDVKKTGAVIQAAMDAAGDAGRLNGVSFDVADHSPLQTKARAAAYKDAKDKAGQYARLSGNQLGRLVSVSETDGAGPRPFPVAVFDKQVSTPVAPGEIRNEVSTNAVYELR